MRIPKSHIITLEMAKQTAIAEKILSAKLDLVSPKHSFLSVFLLLESANSDSFWSPYFAILPHDFHSFPIFYTLEEKILLTGSPFLETINEKNADIEADYKAICGIAPEFEGFSMEEYAKMRMTVCSRIFGMEIDGVKTDGFVPLADMLNHKRPRHTSWYFDQSSDCFTIEALEDIHCGEEVTDSYGQKCNYRFLLNYGFVNRGNDADEYPLKVYLDPKDQFYAVKRSLVPGQEPFVVRIMASTREKSFEELIGLLRFVELEDISQVLPLLIQRDPAVHPFWPSSIPKLSTPLEIRVLHRLQSLIESCLALYPTSLEQDEQLLTTELTENQRNIVLIRKGEKVILKWYLGLVDTCLPILEGNELQVVSGTPYDDYIRHLTGDVVR